MKENIFLALAISIAAAVLTVIGMTYFEVLPSPKTDQQKIAVVDLVRVADALAQDGLKRAGEQGGLDMYNEAIRKASEVLADDGWLVIPKAIVIATPKNESVRDVTDVFIREISGGKSGTGAAK